MGMDASNIITKYFSHISEIQQNQFDMLGMLYAEWNAKINVISRKDISNLYEHHILHSLVIAKFISFVDGSFILDVGTGGGFPGIPLAILFPKCKFVLIDSIGKKICVGKEVVKAIKLKNVTLRHENVIEEKEKYDFVVSRAVMNAPVLLNLVKKNISANCKNEKSNGLICLKGGDLQEELASLKHCQIINVSDYFDEPFFETKKILFVPFSK